MREEICWQAGQGAWRACEVAQMIWCSSVEKISVTAKPGKAKGMEGKKDSW
jgi:hypothetical protein